MDYKTSFKVHFDEADPAGIAFSGIIFTKAHRCYEEFVAELTPNSKDFFLNPETIYPIRHTETEFLAPLFPLETYQALIRVIKIGESSFQLEFDLGKEDKVCARVRSTHVCCDKKTMKKQPLSKEFKENLQKFATPQ